jgi:hypothetical protein
VTRPGQLRDRPSPLIGGYTILCKIPKAAYRCIQRTNSANAGWGQNIRECIGSQWDCGDKDEGVQVKRFPPKSSPGASNIRRSSILLACSSAAVPEYVFIHSEYSWLWSGNSAANLQPMYAYSLNIITSAQYCPDLPCIYSLGAQLRPNKKNLHHSSHLPG